jgi:hypothetical protein
MGRQAELAGMETPTGDKELDALAEAFKRSSKKRKAAQDNELAAREILVDSMKKKKLTVYEDRNADPPLLVTLTLSEKVKVQAIDEVGEGDDDSDGEAVTDIGEQRAKKKQAPSAEA